MTSDNLLFALDELPADHRSGFVAVIGRPNVGKSTLMNALLGQKIAIVSEKPQTTRNRLLGIFTRDDAQLIFMDTPGIYRPHNKLGEYMVELARSAIPDADLVCFLADASVSPSRGDVAIAEMTKASGRPTLLVSNKIDLASPGELEANAEAYRALGPFAGDIAISALHGAGLDELLATMISMMPLGPRYFPEGQVTEQYERFIAGELIREQVLNNLRQEVPHAVAVVVEQFKERDDGSVYIEANIFVEKDSQKGIIIGRGGGMLKRIGQAARAEIEDLVEGKVYLDLWVKVLKNWRKKEHLLRRLGYRMPK